MTATGTADVLRRRRRGHASALQERCRSVAWIVSEDGIGIRVRSRVRGPAHGPTPDAIPLDRL